MLAVRAATPIVHGHHRKLAKEKQRAAADFCPSSRKNLPDNDVNNKGLKMQLFTRGSHFDPPNKMFSSRV